MKDKLNELRNNMVKKSNQTQVPEKVFNELFDRLEQFGAIKWHKANTGSYYIKFKDTRLGSIRISDHDSRTRYRYTYEVFVNEAENVEQEIENIVDSIIKKSKSIHNFDPNLYIVYDEGYIELSSFDEYKQFILTRGK